MKNFLLGMSITFNIIFIIFMIIYYKKVINSPINLLKKEFNKNVKETSLESLLKRWDDL